MAAALDALGALAQESRLAAFRLLVERGPEGLAAGQIAETSPRRRCPSTWASSDRRAW